MVITVYKVTKKQILEYMSKSKRFDGRDLLDMRDIEVKLNISKNAEGSASVKIGKTEVAAGVKMDVAEPYSDHEGEGTMMVTMDLLPLSSPNFEYGAPKVDSIEIARIIDRGIRESGFIDFKKLCIEEGKKVWSIFIDIATINDDGNLIDAGALAALFALKLARMPVYDKKTEKTQYGEFTDEPIPLNEDKMPITTTFFKMKDKTFVDPTREEEVASEARLTVEVSHPKGKDHIINAMQKGGEATLSTEEIEAILEESGKVFKKLNSLIEEELDKAKKSKKSKKD